MNIVGKILVILNLVFALVVGGFLVVDFATRTKWHDAYVALRNEITVQDSGSRVEKDTAAKLNIALKKAETERDTARQQVIDAELALKAQETSAKGQLEEKDLAIKDIQTTLLAKVAEIERRNKESESLIGLLKQREGTIAELTADVRKYREFGFAQEAAYKQSEARLSQQVDRVAELERALQKAAAAPGGAGAGATEKTAARGTLNPPSVYIEGKIDAIHPQDTGLVQISVGSDKGLAKNQTLEVYRLNPTQYLGIIRIVDVQPHEAVGRIERTSTGNRTPLRVGDTVASSLSRN